MRLKPCLATFYFLLLSIVSTYISPALGSDILRYKRSRHRYFTATDDDGVSSSTGEALSTTSASIDDASVDSGNWHARENGNPCLEKYCGAGKECQVTTDGGTVEAVCVCVRRCARKHRPVCASNGRVYANHCELHRTACNTGTSLTTRRLSRCLSNGNYSAQARKDFFAYHTPSKGKNILYAKSRNKMKHHPASKSIPQKDGYGTDECCAQEYEIMKDNLLLYSHARLMAEDNHSKEYLVSIMFSHYDRNNDGNLEREELEQIAEEESMEELSAGCNLSHMISYDDTDGDGRLNVNEFYMAFSKLYSVSVVSLDKSLEVNHISARIGDNVEIKCDVTGTPPPPLVWRRYGTDVETLSEPEIRVFNDGSLYLTNVQLEHAGNYTCHALSNQDVVQTHMLTVYTIPEVQVTPQFQSKRPKRTAKMRCHVVGEPLPRVRWLKNDKPLSDDPPDKYEVVGNGTKLFIKKVDYADTGAYMCEATSAGGLTRDISSLVIQEQPTPIATEEERRFFSFHEWGILVYEPSTCHALHEIRSTDIIPGTQEYVCGPRNVPCSWGRAINIANRYVYVSQPDKDRVLVISEVQMMIIDVVVTDKNPVDLWYVQNLDYVWILNWRSEMDVGIKTIQVIKEAAQRKKHHTVRPEPIDAQFDLVKGLYIPQQRFVIPQDTKHTFKYGYVTHTNQHGMYKLDLANMRYTRTVNLAEYNCVPASVEFSDLYGFMILECEEPITAHPTGQMLLDYLTDSVLAHKPNILGKPAVSPDSRYLVTLDKQDTGVTLVVQEILPDGLKFAFDVKTTLNISDIAFYPSQTTHSYDIYASSIDKEDILFLDLTTGKVEMITGVGKATPPHLTKWGNPNRPIIQSGIFGRYMVSPSNQALFVLNGETRTVNCEIGGLIHPGAIVWFTVSLR
ncbi:follistatin-related protein 5 isoform X1 [Harpegnathos saltator]|uniref:follistatin-related protein 5 isoform X1 n=1 Tax=Harpegnathos saltator TaxID=610380 RepID=UPI00058AD1C1|nr:follistatin-related protein 5 isoform X1 [Harpegnathos saltator]XP_011148679.1 follistatin-related protein 5 isoform X1 [Harpegnathos saltator]XP_011148685.1 follistatin-related protein 5 isoform X1 [Harpegnathos saltator]XP_025156782.1 follistatin-related protein 5 isoform X1 [Harpegnathos saltator]XP_025156783.1 follistatin-related protein 5 isoform X1 [Harpegnathos saltator]